MPEIIKILLLKVLNFYGDQVDFLYIIRAGSLSWLNNLRLMKKNFHFTTPKPAILTLIIYMPHASIRVQEMAW